MLNPLKKIFSIFEKIEDSLKRKKKPRLRKKSKKAKKINQIIFIIIVVALLSFLFYYSGVIKPTCYDNDCFNKAFNKCKPVKYTKIKNNNIYQYKIYRSITNNCKLKITMQKSAPGTDLDIIEALQGKSMNCKIPKQLTRTTDIDDFENLIDYCTGPLKEGMYKLMLQRMYGLVVTQMGDIIKEVEKTIKTF